MTAFYDVVNWFKPGFVLMENVVDILKKEDGIYAKSAMGSLLQMGYQVRMGVIAAYDQGVPQARNRSPCTHATGCLFLSFSYLFFFFCFLVVGLFFCSFFLTLLQEHGSEQTVTYLLREHFEPACESCGRQAGIGVAVIFLKP